LEAGQGLGIAAKLWGQELKCHEAMQACVFGFVNDSHPASTEFLDDSVVRNGLTDH
jgi:hypothetical protein